MKYLILAVALIVSATATAQNQRDTTLKITITLKASEIDSYLSVQSVNVDTLSTISARQATVIKQQAQSTQQQINALLGAAMKPLWDKQRVPVKKGGKP